MLMKRSGASFVKFQSTASWASITGETLDCRASMALAVARAAIACGSVRAVSSMRARDDGPLAQGAEDPSA